MTEPHYVALIHAAIDGELDEHQRAELAGHLLADPESRALRDGLRELCTTLDGIAAVEPPPQLRASILAALPPVTATRLPARRFARQAAPAWRYAAVLAGVLAAGAVFYEAVGGRGPDASEVAGTMAASGPHTSVIVDSVHLNLAQVGGQVNLYRADGGLALEFDLVAPAPVDVLVANGDQTLQINGLGRPDSPGGGRRAVALPGGAARAQTVNITFLVAGREVGTATLNAAAAR